MSDRAITVTVKAQVSDFERGMSRAEQKTQEFDRSVSGMVRNHKSEMTTLGVAGAAAGAAIAGGFVMSAKAAISWESAFAGVIKTVDATEAELGQLEEGLRDMALQIPATHEELAGIAEAAGQLGIETQNILGFTRVMADLSVATNLTSEEAATLFARFANITGLPQTEFENLGSAVVHLGNNFATTEREIGAMALRIAAAGSQIGLSQAEVLGFAAALSDVGIEAQAGGTAISRTFIEIDKAVRGGGATLEKFAETAGMTADEFRTAYQTNASGAIISFIEGLRGISDAGGDVFGVLEDLSLQDIRVRDALLRAAGAGDKFRQAIEESSGAFEENIALSKEAEARYKTVESQMTIAGNAVREMAISFGAILLPVLLPVLEVIKDLAGWFADLPTPIKTVIVVGAGLVGVIAGIGGAALILGPRILMLVDAWKKLRAAMLAAKAAQFVPGIPGSVGAAGSVAARAVPVAGAALAVGVAVVEAKKLHDGIKTTQKSLADTLADLMRAAERGDQDAAERLRKFKDQYVESKGFFTDIGDRLNFTGIRHQSQEIWKQAEALVATEKAGTGAAASVHAFLEANDPQPINTVADATERSTVAASRFLEVNGATADQLLVAGDSAGTAAAEYFELAEATRRAEAAARNLNSMYANAVGTVGGAVDAVRRLRDAEDELKNVQEDRNSSAADIAEAQFQYVDALFSTQTALDALDTRDLQKALEAIAAGLDLSAEEAAELLQQLGVLDGQDVSVYISMYERRVAAANRRSTGGVADRRGFTPEVRQHGGPVRGGSVYQMGEQNMPEIMSGPNGLFLIPGDAGRVFSNADTKTLINAMRGGGAGREVNIYMEGTGVPQVDAQRAATMAAVQRMAEVA